LSYRGRRNKFGKALARQRIFYAFGMRKKVADRIRHSSTVGMAANAGSNGSPGAPETTKKKRMSLNLLNMKVSTSSHHS
jgi:hypothetical protein